MTLSRSFHYPAVFSFVCFLSACGSDSSPDVSKINSTSTDCKITKDQQEMLDQVNEARSNSRMCGGNNMPAVAKLSWNCQLQNAAQRHSGDMLKNNFFNHTGSDGLSVGDRTTASGYSWSRVGENIAANQTTITQVMTGWLKSPGHCSNIMSAGFTEFGSALATASAATNTSDYSHYWTQVFARPR